MNDRFKFRAWDKIRRKYEDLPKLINQKGELVSFAVRDDLSEFYDIEQCTGLKDKNGKLIYENDVLKLIDQGIEYEVSVYWESGMYCFAITSNSANLVFSDLSDNETTCEIIGNIHENADLLENK